MTKLLPLTRGRFALVDDDDFAWARQHKWFVTERDYVYRGVRQNGKNTNVMLHREILGFPDGLEVDHINFDTLDNRRTNLRAVTKSQNQQNRKSANPSSQTGVRGVESRPYRRRPYAVRLWLNGTGIWFGTYATLEEAAKVAAEARRQLMTHAPECLPGATP